MTSKLAACFHIAVKMQSKNLSIIFKELSFRGAERRGISNADLLDTPGTKILPVLNLRSLLIACVGMTSKLAACSHVAVKDAIKEFVYNF